MKESKIGGHRWHWGWDSQLSLWFLVLGLFYRFSTEACHGLKEYGVCSSQPDPWSFPHSGSSEFGPSEANVGIKSLSLTSWSFRSGEHRTWLWLLHLFLLLHAGLHTTECWLPQTPSWSLSPEGPGSKSFPTELLTMRDHPFLSQHPEGTLKSKVAPMTSVHLQGSDNIRKRTPWVRLGHFSPAQGQV